MSAAVNPSLTREAGGSLKSLSAWRTRRCPPSLPCPNEGDGRLSLSRTAASSTATIALRSTEGIVANSTITRRSIENSPISEASAANTWV